MAVCTSRGTAKQVRGRDNLWRLQSCSVVRWFLVGAGMAHADGFLPCRASRGPAPCLGGRDENLAARGDVLRAARERSPSWPVRTCAGTC